MIDPSYTYEAELIRIVDGDTIHAIVDLGMDTFVKKTIRLSGLNCPELSTEAGILAKEYVEKWFFRYAPEGYFMLQTIKDRREKYGRYLGVVSAYKSELNASLLAAGVAVPYGD